MEVRTRKEVRTSGTVVAPFKKDLLKLKEERAIRRKEHIVSPFINPTIPPPILSTMFKVMDILTTFLKNFPRNIISNHALKKISTNEAHFGRFIKGRAEARVVNGKYV
jgi:hypothetical protein